MLKYNQTEQEAERYRTGFFVQQAVPPIAAQQADEVEELLATVRKEAEAYRITRRSTKIMQAGFIFIIGLMVLNMIKSLFSGKQVDLTFLCFMGLTGSFGGAALAQNHKKAAEKLAQYDDIRAVGLLTETLESGDKGLIQVSRAALIRLLPKMRFSDANLLNAGQRAILNRILPRVRTREDRELSKAILKAYEQVGDEKAVGVVEKLANGPVADFDSDLRQAANDCLPFLRDSIAKRQASMVLLRASQAEEVHPETLLRPANGTAETPPEQLLRPVSTPPPER